MLAVTKTHMDMFHAMNERTRGSTPLLGTMYCWLTKSVKKNIMMYAV